MHVALSVSLIDMRLGRSLAMQLGAVVDSLLLPHVEMTTGGSDAPCQSEWVCPRVGSGELSDVEEEIEHE